MSDLTLSGWYEDPYGAPGLLRWWDGRQWTEATEPAQAAPVPPYGHPPAPLYGQEPPPEPLYGHEPRAAGRSALPWLLAAGAGALVIVAVVVATVFVFHDESGGKSVASSTPTASSPVPSPPTVTGTRSSVTGTVTDDTAGLSYARLGSPWAPADSGWLRPDLFSAGQVSVVQSPFEQYTSFNATSLSGVPRTAESAGYTGPQNLSAVARRVTGRILTEHFAMAKTQTTLSSGARTVDGHQAWLERFRLDFTDARSRGWKFTADTVAILVVDRGDRRLGELWVSVPNTFANQGDVDQVLDSVKVG